MVKVREDQPLNADGSVNLDAWLANLNAPEAIKTSAQLKKAVYLAQELDTLAQAQNKQWYAGASSLRTGLEMADILAELNADETTLLAAILFRSVRESLISTEEVDKQFGSQVAKLISSTQQMAKISQIANHSGNASEQHQLEKLRKMLVALLDDVRVALVKVAERTCALRQIKTAKPAHQQKVAQEVFHIYAPLAHRLGIGQIKWELEDLAFRYLHPEKYKQIAKLLKEKRLERDSYIQQAVADLSTDIANEGITKADIQGRAKHIYSIWRKMQRKKIDFSQVHDLRALRVLVPEVKDCYTVLGLLHAKYTYLPQEFDDYIATPKKNGYRSLHTAVIAPDGKVLEVQIRTFAMHQEAELGVCAHWAYKGTDKVNKGDAYEEKISWLRHLLEWQEELGELGELGDLSGSITPDRIYVFTPEGQVIDLMQGATPIDFAYRVHTEVGHRCRGAKINGRIVPLTYTLKTGEQVEILTTSASKSGPSRDWLNPHLGYVKTSRCRAKIQSWFRQQDRDKNSEAGRQQIDKELKRLGLTGLDTHELASRLNFSTHEDLYAALGAGDIGLGQVISSAEDLLIEAGHQLQTRKRGFSLERLLKLGQQKSSSYKNNQQKNKDEITISGVGNLKTQLANCCQPLPQDAILGYITLGRGVTIHRQDCTNIMQLQSDEPQRVVEVEWSNPSSSPTYPVDISITAWDRSGLLRDVTTLLANEKANILLVNTKTRKEDNLARLAITLEVDSLASLSRLMSKISQLPNVLEVNRTN